MIFNKISKPIVTVFEPVAKEKLIKELTPDKFLKHTSKGNNEIYSFTFKEAPSVMYEVARLREISFSAIGCGTGNLIDIDDYDIEQPAYKQLIVWNPREQEIVGGYRYAICADYINNLDKLAMAHYFKFSQKFIVDYLPYSFELGRAWVNPDYQPSSGNRKSIFALDNLWDGIGVVVQKNPNIKYLYGKLTIPKNYNSIARMLIQWLLNHYFGDKRKLITPENPVIYPKIISISGITLNGNNFNSDYKLVSSHIRTLGSFIPPLVSAYIGLASKITTFGTVITPELNDSFETGMMIDIKDIYPEKYERYIQRFSITKNVVA